MSANHQHKKNTKQKIIAAATELFAMQGYSATSISQIAKHANISNQSLIFHHYNNKSKLWELSKQYLLKSKKLSIDLMLQQAETSLDAFIDVYVVQRFQFFKTNRDFVRMMAWQYLEDDAHSLFFTNTETIDKTINLIRKMQAQQIINSTLNPACIIAFLSNLTSGYFIKNMTRWMDTKNEQEYIELIVRQSHHLLAP